jgi:hypothetical protein
MDTRFWSVWTNFDAKHRSHTGVFKIFENHFHAFHGFGSKALCVRVDLKTERERATFKKKTIFLFHFRAISLSRC